MEGFRIISMKRLYWLLLVFTLSACQPQSTTTSFLIVDGSHVIRLQTASNSPAAILKETGIKFSDADRLEFNGAELPYDFSLPSGGSYVLQIRRARQVTLLTPDGQTVFQTTAVNVGSALAQTGLRLYAADFVAPPPETPINADLTVSYRPAQDLTVKVDGKTRLVKSSGGSIGQALASAGIVLMGLDKSLPDEWQPLPVDGQIKVIRVSETVTLVEKSIPFSKKYEYSTDLAVGEQKVRQAGVPGLIVSRVRVRLEDGVEVARTTEAETVVRQPQESIVSLGSLAEIKTLAIPGGQVQYWRAVQMYATAYSPCRSGISGCSYGTASGLPVKHGVVAMTRDLYNQLSGSQVYIPGYGVAVIADVGGGFPDGRLWIDLGYGDDDFQGWSGMVMVYFLAPAPASIPAALQ